MFRYDEFNFNYVHKLLTYLLKTCVSIMSTSNNCNLFILTTLCLSIPELTSTVCLTSNIIPILSNLTSGYCFSYYWETGV